MTLASSSLTAKAGPFSLPGEPAGIDPAKLAPLVPMRGAIGAVLPAVAEVLGIPAGLPVFPGTIDSITSAVGTGALTPADAAVVIGTTAVIVTHIPEHRSRLEASLVSVPSPVPGMYYVMAENGLGGRAFEWAQRLFGYDSPETALDRSRTSDILRACIAKLSPAHREIINLVYYHEMSVEEVGRIVGIPQSTVKTRMFYARKQLAELLKSYGVESLAA